MHADDVSITPAPVGVTAALDELRRGQITIDMAATRFREAGIPTDVAAEMARLNAPR